MRFERYSYTLDTRSPMRGNYVGNQERHGDSIDEVLALAHRAHDASPVTVWGWAHDEAAWVEVKRCTA